LRDDKELINVGVLPLRDGHAIKQRFATALNSA
jgi:hypothetical protein